MKFKRKNIDVNKVFEEACLQNKIKLNKKDARKRPIIIIDENGKPVTLDNAGLHGARRISVGKLPPLKAGDIKMSGNIKKSGTVVVSKVEKKEKSVTCIQNE